LKEARLLHRQRRLEEAEYPRISRVDRVGEIFFRAYVNLFSRRWGRLETGVVTGFGQFGGTSFSPNWGTSPLPQ